MPNDNDQFNPAYYNQYGLLSNGAQLLGIPLVTMPSPMPARLVATDMRVLDVTASLAQVVTPELTRLLGMTGSAVRSNRAVISGLQHYFAQAFVGLTPVSVRTIARAANAALMSLNDIAQGTIADQFRDSIIICRGDLQIGDTLPVGGYTDQQALTIKNAAEAAIVAAGYSQPVNPAAALVTDFFAAGCSHEYPSSAERQQWFAECLNFTAPSASFYDELQRYATLLETDSNEISPWMKEILIAGDSDQSMTSLDGMTVGSLYGHEKALIVDIIAAYVTSARRRHPEGQRSVTLEPQHFGAVATPTGDMIHVEPLPGTCQRCSNTSVLYATNELDYLCGDCYVQHTHNAFGCGGCNVLQSPWDARRMNGRVYCVECARRLFDCCRYCDAVAARDSMARNGGNIVCGNCYRPEWKPGEWTFSGRNTHRLVPRGITFGVEIETSNSENYTRMENQTVWGCVPETSTDGREFISPVLHGDKGLQEITDFIAKWGSEWEVDSACGTHIHLGLHQYSLEQKRNIAYAYRVAWPFFAKLMPSRAMNSMCGNPQYSVMDLMGADDVEDFAAERDRFEYVNWRSLLKYGTIEIRMLAGTLDANLINLWVRWNAAFIKKAARLTIRTLINRLANPHIYCENVDIEVMRALRAALPRDDMEYRSDEPDEWDMLLEASPARPSRRIRAVTPLAAPARVMREGEDYFSSYTGDEQGDSPADEPGDSGAITAGWRDFLGQERDAAAYSVDLNMVRDGEGLSETPAFNSVSPAEATQSRPRMTTRYAERQRAAQSNCGDPNCDACNGDIF